VTEFKRLDDIDAGAQLDALPKSQLRDLQRALSFLGYALGAIDGGIGPKTRNAWAEFVADNELGDPKTVTAGAIERLKERVAAMSAELDVSLANKEQVKAAIAGVAREMGLGLTTQIAYILATGQWETNHTFEPVKEAYWLSETWRRNNLHYYPFYGRGLVQLTWKRNYEMYRDILDVDMVNKPDLALDARVSLFVIVHGFKTGTFTTRKLSEFVDEEKTDYKNARRCINGQDRWDDIKKLAEQYAEEL
jgi:hypothetical protein